ncbi:MAG: ATP-binding cassette domain-containing protein, partial [Desulfobacterales bacterium]
MAHRNLKEEFPSPAPDIVDRADKDKLIIQGLRQNNLKDLNIEIPHGKITAIVGPSGSGKSSLAFD